MIQKKDINKEKSIGMFYKKHDKKTGKLLIDKKNQWEEMSSVLSIKESGYVKDKGYMNFQNFLMDKMGRIYAIDKFFDAGIGLNMNSLISKTFIIKNLFVLKLNKDFKLIADKVFEKKSSSIPITNFTNTTSIAAAYGSHFDYLYTEKLPKNKGFMIYYYSGDKNENGRSGSLSTISAVGNKYTQYKFPLTKKGGEVQVLKAKKGCFLVVEKTKDIEVKLEKMNY